jgi:hypothetical protein
MFGKAGDELLTCQAVTLEINRITKAIKGRSKSHQQEGQKRIKELQVLFNEKCKESVIGTDIVGTVQGAVDQFIQPGQATWDQLTDYFGAGTTPGMPGPIPMELNVPPGGADAPLLIKPVTNKTWWIVGGVAAVGLFLFFRSRR